MHNNLYKILVGSTYFFQSINEFESKDIDYVILENAPKYYNFYKQIKMGKEDLFYWNRENIFNYDYNNNPMAVGKFLVPEILNSLNIEFGAVLDLLHKYLPQVKERHNYQLQIFNFYIQNKAMKLTESQLEETYNVYKKHRS